MCGVASDVAQAVRVATATRPDVVVLDLQLPDGSGVDVARQLAGLDPMPKVLVLSASGEQPDVLDAVEAGATGYLVKSASAAELVDAVRATSRGEAVFTPGLAALLLGEYRKLSASGDDGSPSLTARETDLAKGRPLQQDDTFARRGQQVRGSQAGDAAADDDHIRMLVVVESREGRTRQRR